MAMKCQDVMKRDVQTASADETVEVAAQRMRDENVGFLPVLDPRGVIGTITDRDLTLRVIANSKPATTKVIDAMTHELVTCRPDDDLTVAEQLMARHQKSRIMCLDDKKRLVGVISLSDIAKHDTAPNASETLRKVSAREAHA